VANLQVKNLPDDLHDELRARAAREGRTLSELVASLLRREMALPSMSDWLAELEDVVEQHPVDADVDVPALLDEVRGEASR
jgi:plasmid stability protein